MGMDAAALQESAETTSGESAWGSARWIRDLGHSRR